MDYETAALYAGGLPWNKKKASIKRLEKRNRSFKRKVKKRIKGYRNDLVNNATRAEIDFKGFLERNDITYDFQKVITTQGKHYIVDFYLRDYHAVIEIDGGYHNDPAQKKLDKTRTNNLLKSKIIGKVIRFKNEEVSGDNIHKLFIERFVPFAKPGAG